MGKPYRIYDSLPLQTALGAFEQSGDDDTLTLRGLCPDCDHEFVCDLALKAQLMVPGRGLTGQGVSDEITRNPTQHVVQCACSDDHDGRPEGKTGCGAMTKIVIEPPGSRGP